METVTFALGALVVFVGSTLALLAAGLMRQARYNHPPEGKAA